MKASFIPLEELNKRFNQFAEEFDDFSELWNFIIPLIHNTTMKRFAIGGTEDGPWAPLKPATIALRIKEGTWRKGVSTDQPILQREGDLRRSLMAKEAGGVGLIHIEKVTPKNLLYGTNLKKAMYLQGDLTGKIKGKGIIPSRPFLFIHEEQHDDILFLTEDFIIDGWNRSMK